MNLDKLLSVHLTANDYESIANPADSGAKVCPLRRFTRKPEGVYGQIFFVRIGDDWRVSPTIEQVPTDAQNQTSVKVLWDWPGKQN